MSDYLTLKGAHVEISGAPEVISVLPFGHVTSSKGDFDVDEESFREMCRGIAQRGVDLVVDYEHQTLKGVQAPAAGWVKELFLEDDHIKARVEWTPQGARYLENKEYRYLSPVIAVRKTDNKATVLHSIALTNTPAIENMEPIVNSLNFIGGEPNMELMKQIAQILGLMADAGEEDVVAALTACIEENKSLKAAGDTLPPDPGLQSEKVVANKTVCELLGLTAGAPTADVAAKIMALKGGCASDATLAEEVKSLKNKLAEREADEAVTLALKAGKITPAQKTWAMDYAQSNPTGFASFVDKAPQVVPLGAVSLEDVKSLKSDHLDDATLLVCKQLGLSPEEVKQYGLED